MQESLLQDLTNECRALKESCEDILTDPRGPPSDGSSFIAMKQTLLMNYCVHLSVFIALRMRGRSVGDGNLLKQLLEMRTIIEKLRPLDAKLRAHTDRLLRIAPAAVPNDGSSSMLTHVSDNDPLSYCPNPEALRGVQMEKHGGHGEPQEIQTIKKGTKLGQSGDAGRGTREVYRPPRVAPVHYTEETKRGPKKIELEQQRNDRRREGLMYSDMMETLREEFGDNPEEVHGSSLGSGAVSQEAARKLRRKETERQEFEEERMIRLPNTKKNKKERRAAERSSQRLDTIADLGNVGDLLHFGKSKTENGGLSFVSSSSSSGKAKAKLKGTKELEMAVGAVRYVSFKKHRRGK